ncbi:MAG: hypothetical protein ABSE46_08960 [Terracidiphilus sp.]|jgi:hypothetical protein
MNAAVVSRKPAYLCALVLLVCALATFPVAEIGMNDDWSYVQSARVLAQTGHIVYNGWATAMVGWQLYLGALFITLFGPSFTSIRASTLFVALMTAFLTQRTLVRAGVSSRNATIGTLALVLSPLFLPLAVSYMTDINGFFCILLCLYACLRALRSQSNRAVLAWLACAALSNAVGGTVRQIAWLGVLVMFPCAVWLLRRRPYVPLIGVLLYALSLVIVFGSLQWFNQQPYSVPEHLIEGKPGFGQLNHLAVQLLSFFLGVALFLLPILIAFVSSVSFRNRRTAAVLVIGGLLCLAAPIPIFLYHPSTLNALLAPFNGNCVTPFGLERTTATKGYGPLVLALGSRFAITLVVLVAVVCFFAYLIAGNRTAARAQSNSSLSPPVARGVSQPIRWPVLIILLGPFVLAYLSLLIPRGLSASILDRYALPLLLIGSIVLLRLYQERVRPALPLASSALVLLFALYAVAGTHDVFGMYRARLDAINELRAAGIADTSIDAGLEYNGMTQIERQGHIPLPDIRIPASAYLSQASIPRDDCQPQWAALIPAVVPVYALSYDPRACGGLASFPAVSYHEWLVARTVPIYIVNAVKPASVQR